MAREFEVKYRLTENAKAAIARKYGPMDTIHMETVYYDTPSGALSARKWMLRRRLENGHSLCTLKTPGEKGGRGEWEVAEGDIRQALPKLTALGAPEALLLLAEEGLTQLCAASFTRQVSMVRFGQSQLELALDQGLLLGPKGTLPLLELEAELKSGEDGDVLAFGQQLEKDFDLVHEPDSKFKRARSLARERR